LLIQEGSLCRAVSTLVHRAQVPGQVLVDHAGLGEQALLFARAGAAVLEETVGAEHDADQQQEQAQDHPGGANSFFFDFSLLHRHTASR
jgi:hypothetical protein